jgi:outer membrane protein
VSAANWTEVTRPPVDRNTSTQNATLSASQPLYRPANRIATEQGQRGVDVAQAQLDAART